VEAINRPTWEQKKYMMEMEDAGLLSPECATCNEHFYPAIKRGQKICEVFAPSHKASDKCESGKHPHCTCDTCF